MSELFPNSDEIESSRGVGDCLCVALYVDIVTCPEIGKVK